MGLSKLLTGVLKTVTFPDHFSPFFRKHYRIVVCLKQWKWKKRSSPECL